MTGLWDCGTWFSQYPLLTTQPSEALLGFKWWLQEDRHLGFEILSRLALKVSGLQRRAQKGVSALPFTWCGPSTLWKMRASAYCTAPCKVAGLLPPCYRRASGTRTSSAELISQYTPFLLFLDATWCHARVVSWVPNETESSSRVEPHFFLLLALRGAWLRGEHTGLLQAVSEVEKQPCLHCSPFTSSHWRRRKWWRWWAQVSSCFYILQERWCFPETRAGGNPSDSLSPSHCHRELTLLLA